jgi:hypothetical protein
MQQRAVYFLSSHNESVACFGHVRCSCMLQHLHATLHPGGNVPIAWWLLLFGCIQLVLSQIPTMHHLRHVNAVAVAMTAVWTIMIAVECFQTGAWGSAAQVSAVGHLARSAMKPKRPAWCTAAMSCMAWSQFWNRQPPAGQALRRAGTDISFAPDAESPGLKALGAFEAVGILSYGFANILLPEVLVRTRANNA